MSKEEFLKIQTCDLKVNIHCDGCKKKVKKILQKIDGVYTTNIDAEQGKVTVSGNADAATLIKKLNKAGKYAELWGAQKPSNIHHQNQLNNQFKNVQNDNGKGGNQNNNKSSQRGGNNNQPKGGQQNQQQMKAFQDLKLPQFKDAKMPHKEGQNPKADKFNLPHEEGLNDDEYEDYDDEDGDFDDDDMMDDLQPLSRGKPMMDNNGVESQGGHMMLMNGQQHPQFINTQAKAGNNGGGNNGKKGGGGGDGNMPVQVHSGNDGKNGGSKKGGGSGNNHGGNQNQGGGNGKNGGKNCGVPPDSKSGDSGGGSKDGNSGRGGSKDGNSGHGGGNQMNGDGSKKGGGMNDGIHGMGNMNPEFNHGVVGGQMGSMPMAQMANMQMGQMGGIPAVHGLPAAATGPKYSQGVAPEMIAGNSYPQQYLAQMMMNQQRANGNERFQPLMYARPPPAVNYMPPYPYPYPYPPPPPVADPFTHSFSDENTSSCNVM